MRTRSVQCAHDVTNQCSRGRCGETGAAGVVTVPDRLQLGSEFFKSSGVCDRLHQKPDSSLYLREGEESFVLVKA